MAALIIPPPDAAGYWHFTYITTDTLDGRWYGGKRSTQKHPLSDRYLGSGNWIKKHPARPRLKRKIVAFFATSAEVFAAEAGLITWNEVLDDPLCMNETEGGSGMTVDAIRRLRADPVFRSSYVAGIARRNADPEWQKNQAARARSITANTEWREKNAAALRRLATDPVWRANNLAAVRRRVADPKWDESRAAAGRKRSANSARRREAKRRAELALPNAQTSFMADLLLLP